MSIYDTIMHPLEKHILGNIRKTCIAHAEGHILEIGVGTGVNAAYYNPATTKSLTGLDVKIKPKTAARFGGRMRIIEGRSEKLPFDDHSFDTIVGTLLLCSVTSPRASMKEINRVLRPGGKYIFIEHILPAKKTLRGLFQGVNGVWSFVSCGCHLNRKTDKLIRRYFKNVRMRKIANGIFCYGIARKPV